MRRLPRPRTSSPSAGCCPALSRSSPRIARSSVVLPEPLGPEHRDRARRARRSGRARSTARGRRDGVRRRGSRAAGRSARHCVERPRQRLDVRLHPREVSLAVGEGLGELDDRDRRAPRPRRSTSVVSAPPVCVFTITTPTSPERSSLSESRSVAGATSCPSSTASLKAAGVDVHEARRLDQIERARARSRRPSARRAPRRSRRGSPSRSAMPVGEGVERSPRTSSACSGLSSSESSRRDALRRARSIVCEVVPDVLVEALDVVIVRASVLAPSESARARRRRASRARTRRR